jgi:hypothetical protein
MALPLVVCTPPEASTLVTLPEPLGVAQVPSPRQNVVRGRWCREFRLVTGRLPETSAVRLTAPKVGAPAALPCRTVVVVPSEPRTVTSSVPLPRTIRFAVSAPAVCVTVPAPPAPAGRS